MSVSIAPLYSLFFFFFFNDTATTEIYTLPLHDALPISASAGEPPAVQSTSCECVIPPRPAPPRRRRARRGSWLRSEEHTSELQSPCNLVCRLLLEKKKKIVQLYNDRSV